MTLERVDVEHCEDRLQIVLHRARYDFVLAKLTPGQCVLEIGTGPGTFIRELFPKCESYVGVEFDHDTCLEARRKNAGMAEIIQADFMTVDLSSANVVAMHLSDSANSKLAPKLERELQAGARVVSLDYSLPGWAPEKELIAKGALQHKLYLYRV